MSTHQIGERIKLRMMCPTCDSEVSSDHSRCPVDGGLLCPVPGQDQILGTVVGGYLIRESIGQGSSGQVYLAEGVGTGLRVAMKVLKYAFTADPVAVKRFQQEAQALIALDHADIPSVYDFGVLPDGRPFIVMEYVEGRTLADVLNEQGKLEPDAVVQLFMDICDALIAAHRSGILHRDIKPGNIILDSTGNTKVVDFGLAKFAELETSSTLTRTNAALGTPAYMSPEQCYGSPLDARSDVYSLGCVMYECLTGKPVFPSANSFKCMHDHVFTAPQPVSDLQPGVSLHLEALVLNCLEKEPEERIQSMEDVKRSLIDVRGRRTTKMAYIQKSFRKLKKKALAGKKARSRKNSNASRRTLLHPLGNTDFSRMVDADRRLQVVLGVVTATVVAIFVWAAVMQFHHKTQAVSQWDQKQSISATTNGASTTAADDPHAQRSTDEWDVDPWHDVPMTGLLDNVRNTEEGRKIQKIVYDGVWCKNGLWSFGEDDDKHTAFGKIALTTGLQKDKTNNVDFPAFAGVPSKDGWQWYLLNEKALGVYDIKADTIETVPTAGSFRQASAIAYDSEHHRVAVLASNVSDRIFMYSPDKEGHWANLDVQFNHNAGTMRGLAYCSDNGCFYTLVRDGAKGTSLMRISASGGVIEESKVLSTDLCNIAGWNIGRISLIAQGKYLIAALNRSPALHEHSMTARVFVIDRDTGEIVYAREIGGTEAGAIADY